MKADPQIAALAALLRELALPPTLLSLLLAHAEAVRERADRLGLVAAADAPTIVARHTADSLLFALVREPEPGEGWADVGSGAGFPGLVLAICYPATSFTLIEPQQRRGAFLELQRDNLGLDNVIVRIERSEAVEGGTFDVVVARALAEPALALEGMLRLAVRHGTVMVAAGSNAVAPHWVEDVRIDRAGVDSPGRLFMMTQTPGGA